MKQQKNKIIFITSIVFIALLMVWYYMEVVTDSSKPQQELQQPKVPTLEEKQKAYSSKLEAVNDIQKERETTPPSVYSEADIDSTGRYDPDLEEKRRRHIVDSIYRHGRINYAKANDSIMNRTPPKNLPKKMETEPKTKLLRDFTKAHSAFFSSEPLVETVKVTDQTLSSDPFVIVEVNGEQTVRVNERLELRLAMDVVIAGQAVPRNTLVYAFVTFQPNRVLLTISNIHNRPINLKAYDLLDGKEGIYIKNSFRAEAGQEVLDDVVQDINIAGLPQVGGIKQVFRRNNRNVRVTVRDNYQLILKGTNIQ